jgi:dephospho-CoA kinase
MSRIIGLTGGIGSGKSAVSERFAQCGAGVVDTDVIARTLTGVGGAALDELRDAFGGALMTDNGALNREAMRNLVFSDPIARARLEAILHPRIRQEAQQQAQTACAGGVPYVIMVVPLLGETGFCKEWMSRILVVDCPPALQIARVMARSGLSADTVRFIMDAQADRAYRCAMADDLIDNTADLDALDAQVAKLHDRYAALPIK